MRKLLLICCVMATALVSCGTKNQSWEYKIVKVAGKDAEVMADYGSLVYGDQTTMLNKMGKDGWELISTYTDRMIISNIVYIEENFILIISLV